MPNPEAAADPVPLTFDEVCALCDALPEVGVGTSYGTQALKVRDKLMARMKEDGVTLVVKVPFEVRSYLLDNQPDAYFITDHYRGYPAVLARLAVIDRQHLAAMLEEAWRMVAPKRLLREHDARTAAEGGS
ncbi:MAG TPA: MmcQ/YjbR family DNA-binding protein [Longimicrobiaceae bacterium]|nr:MmcQ/YjbR family DNA-binding protein [Longimicrobiaceae bacterium]